MGKNKHKIELRDNVFARRASECNAQFQAVNKPSSKYGSNICHNTINGLIMDKIHELKDKPTKHQSIKKHNHSMKKFKHKFRSNQQEYAKDLKAESKISICDKELCKYFYVVIENSH